MDLVTIILGAISVLGVIATIFFGFESKRKGKRVLELDAAREELETRRKSFSWQEVQAGAVELLRKELKEFRPDALILMAGPGAVIASVAMAQFKYIIPVYVIMLQDATRDVFSFEPNEKDYSRITSSRWRIYIPKSIFNDEVPRLLYFDDCVISGDTLTKLRIFFEEQGYTKNKNNIRFVTLVCSQISVDSNKDPDNYWYLNPYADFYFPWGKWY